MAASFGQPDDGNYRLMQSGRLTLFRRTCIRGRRVAFGHRSERVWHEGQDGKHRKFQHVLDMEDMDIPGPRFPVAEAGSRQ
jgi:hypothetical protein